MNIAFFVLIEYVYLMLKRPSGLFSIALKRSVHALIIACASVTSPQPSTSTCLFSKSLYTWKNAQSLLISESSYLLNHLIYSK